MSEQSSGTIGPVKGCLVPLSTDGLEFKENTAIFPFVQGLMKRHSCVRLFAVPWTAACQAPLSMEFFRQEYWSQLLFLTPGDLPDPGIEPMSLASPALAGGFFPIVPLGSADIEQRPFKTIADSVRPHR